jgi:hypothetical protein
VRTLRGQSSRAGKSSAPRPRPAPAPAAAVREIEYEVFGELEFRVGRRQRLDQIGGSDRLRGAAWSATPAREEFRSACAAFDRRALRAHAAARVA